jgi:nucleoside-diphosphate-sugar epimerase
MRILVTGSEGSLAQEIIPRFLGEGLEVVGVDNCSTLPRL